MIVEDETGDNEIDTEDAHVILDEDLVIWDDLRDDYELGSWLVVNKDLKTLFICLFKISCFYLLVFVMVLKSMLDEDIICVLWLWFHIGSKQVSKTLLSICVHFFLIIYDLWCYIKFQVSTNTFCSRFVVYYLKIS